LALPIHNGPYRTLNSGIVSVMGLTLRVLANISAGVLLLVGVYCAGFAVLAVCSHMLIPVYGNPDYKWFFSDWPLLIIWPAAILVVFISPALLLWRSRWVSLTKPWDIAGLVVYFGCLWVAIEPLTFIVRLWAR